ncbi:MULTISPECIES: M3 family metallopeptidase [unclassified Janthinobacterium]|uniref:M3 family metallopeptidase n=1 Tax=unclassified Janthinobacterium TaxID=2610881 RepID=UPI00034B573A|nr:MULTISPECIES: M3 family metallopeptidase [unclassified Janthinobacterium]MEC5163065.1 thimet oligopeptidase [Janthinobacterium sp. CG_S6]
MLAQRHLVLSLALPLAALCAALSGAPAAAAPAPADPLHAWAAGNDPAKLERWVDGHLAAARASVDKLLAARGARTVANTLRHYDEALNQLSLAGNQAYLLYAVGQGAALRDKAQALNRKVASASATLNLNRAVYQALGKVVAAPGDAATRHYLERTLLLYRLAGVDRDDASRARIHALQDKITELSLVFGRNVQDGTLKVGATLAELDGLPADYIARHQPDADGRYTLTTDQPDAAPVFDFAHNAELRRRMYLAYHARAYPANRQVLLELLATRQELAGILGFASYADFATADQMIGSAANVRKLFGEVDQASHDAMQKEYAQLLAFAQGRQPELTAIAQSDANYWIDQYRRERYAFDTQSVRPYFAYDKVEAGILDAAAKIFRVQFKPVNNVARWHASVTLFDVVDGGRKVGRIYLDMHPREGKDKWFSSAAVVPGIRGRQLPEGMLICNFSGGAPGDPGLMQYSEVVTYFHEFGHLMHHILGSQNRWSGQGGFNVEGDFVEAPSQMLEEFFRSHSVLAPFARHYQSGAVLSAETVQRMNAANAFGRGYWAQRQLFYASLSLRLHDRPVAEADPDALLREAAARYSPFSFVEGNHLYASFTHLTGYASNYYTYVLDKVIALDLYSRFERARPLDGPAAARYRKSVIDPGATKPAAQLVQDFLGRPQNMDAFKGWLGEQFEATP